MNYFYYNIPDIIKETQSMRSDDSRSAMIVITDAVGSAREVKIEIMQNVKWLDVARASLDVIFTEVVKMEQN